MNLIFLNVLWTRQISLPKVIFLWSHGLRPSPSQTQTQLKQSCINETLVEWSSKAPQHETSWVWSVKRRNESEVDLKRNENWLVNETSNEKSKGKSTTGYLFRDFGGLLLLHSVYGLHACAFRSSKTWTEVPSHQTSKPTTGYAARLCLLREASGSAIHLGSSHTANSGWTWVVQKGQGAISKEHFEILTMAATNPEPKHKTMMKLLLKAPWI